MVLGVAGGVAVPATAQREVVQSLTPPPAQSLRNALTRLSTNPTDLTALLAAGEAAYALDDVEAATGFFLRAREVAPNNERVASGLARTSLRQNRPVDALRLFAEAERLGASPGSLGADRGLAFDLAGDNASAQAAYRASLSAIEDPETRRRLAISLALSGDAAGFEAALLPLLQAGDRAAFRTRAFGLAALDRADEAVEIAEAMMPADMALRLAPYLQTMARLSRTQKAAAANLGIFPRSADIGRDAPPLLAGSSNPVRAPAPSPDAALTPTGPVMGSRPIRPAAPTPAPVEVTPMRPRRAGELQVAQRPSAQAVPPAAASSAPAPQAVRVDEAPPVTIELPPVDTPVASASVAQVAETATPVVIARSVEVAPPPAPPEPSISVADAFGDLAINTTVSTPARGAVDITAIEPAREKPAAKPAAPAHPARYWVQVATGQDRSALAFDWRRIARKADGALDGLGPFAAQWNATNRLLSGPFITAQAAQAMVTRLAEAGIDSFRFDSAQGEVVDRLD